MSEILVYVNNVLTCSVDVCDNADHTLESFRKNIVDKQVDDILCYPYKFTRPVNDQRIVVGVKQESVLSASKCIDHNRGIYLVREETNNETCVKIETGLEKVKIHWDNPPPPLRKFWAFEPPHPTLRNFQSLPWGGGGMDIFWNYTMLKFSSIMYLVSNPIAFSSQSQRGKEHTVPLIYKHY